MTPIEAILTPRPADRPCETWTDPETGIQYAYSLRGGYPRSGSVWENCAACGLPSPRKTMRKVRGVYFGTSCGCAKSAE